LVKPQDVGVPAPSLTKPHGRLKTFPLITLIQLISADLEYFACAPSYCQLRRRSFIRRSASLRAGLRRKEVVVAFGTQGLTTPACARAAHVEVVRPGLNYSTPYGVGVIKLSQPS